MKPVFSTKPSAQKAFNWVRGQLEARVREQCAPCAGERFLLRLGHHFRDFYDPLLTLYGERLDFAQHLTALGDLLLDSYVARPERLRLRDDERYISPDWFQQETQAGYVCYADRFAGTLRAVAAQLDYLQELGITYLHLMPVLQPRPAPNDGGYAVQDYRAVDPQLGTMDDLAALAQQLHTRGMSLCIDLVLNHTAREHPWAQHALAGDRHYLDYYLTFTERTQPDVYERTLREVFPDFAPGNFTWVPEMIGGGRWVWTTFNAFQWDLNYRNPAVFREMAATMLFLANQGVDVLRLDALPFIWKRMGTDCENQPEVHLLVQAFRALVRVAAPAVIFKAEAIVPPDKLVPYLGVGAATGKVCELAYHNQLMVLLWSTLATRQVALLTHTLHAMPATPAGTTWLTYIRNHDDIGWAITEENAAAVGENDFLHRRFLNAFYSGEFPGSFARGARFQSNPRTQDARISGTAAALAGVEQALALDNPQALDLAIARLLLLHSVVLAFGGIPLISMGDELGMRNDDDFASDPQHADDNRWLHRPRFDWQQAAQRHELHSVSGRIFAGLQHLLAARAAAPVLHGANPTQPMWSNNPHVFALARQHPRGNLLLLANFHEEPQHVSAALLGYAGLQGVVYNLLAPDTSTLDVSSGLIELAAYETCWLVEHEQPLGS
jgi:amylosucrase